jgi:hypothetical protein
MREDIKQLWVDRLRSGQDRQGDGYLNRNGKKCCLGVLCEILVENQIPIGPDNLILERYEPDQVGAVGYGFSGGHRANISVLPKEVAARLEMTNDGEFEKVDPIADEGYHEETLANLNDGGSTFEEIADIIEEYF